MAHSHDGGTLIDGYPYRSGMCEWNPAFKTAFAVLALVVCLVLDSLPAALMTALFMGGLTVFVGRLPARKYLSLLLVPAVFLIFGTAAIAFGVSGVPKGDYDLPLHFFYVYATRESLGQAALVAAKAFGAVGAMYMLTLSTPACEIIAVLKKCRVPGLIIELMYLIYRCIFLLLDTYGRMRTAARARLGYGTAAASVRTFGSQMANLLAVSLKRSGETYDAMESRCYCGELNFLEEEKPVQKKQILAAAVCAALVFSAWRLGGGG